MRFLNWLGIENVDFRLNTERLGFAIFWTIFMLGASFLPAFQIPNFFRLSEFSTDFSNERIALVLFEVGGLLLNLINLKGLALWLFSFSIFEIFMMMNNHLFVLNLINAYIEKIPRLLSDERVTLGWGWIVIILAPMIVGLGILREFWLAKR
jgi:hypothetical protein